MSEPVPKPHVPTCCLGSLLVVAVTSGPPRVRKQDGVGCARDLLGGRPGKGRGEARMQVEPREKSARRKDRLRQNSEQFLGSVNKASGGSPRTCCLSGGPMLAPAAQG